MNFKPTKLKVIVSIIIFLIFIVFIFPPICLMTYPPKCYYFEAITLDLIVGILAYIILSLFEKTKRKNN